MLHFFALKKGAGFLLLLKTELCQLGRILFSDESSVMI